MEERTISHQSETDSAVQNDHSMQITQNVPTVRKHEAGAFPHAFASAPGSAPGRVASRKESSR